MPNLILYSVFDKQAKINFERNVIQGINIKDLKSIVSEDILECNNENSLCFWGCKNSDYYKPKVKKIKSGDSIAFAKDRNFFITANIANVIESKELARYLFNDEIYSYIFKLENVREINISYQKLFKELGYASNLKVNGLFLVNDMRSDRFFSKYGSIDSISDN